MGLKSCHRIKPFSFTRRKLFGVPIDKFRVVTGVDKHHAQVRELGGQVPIEGVGIDLLNIFQACFL